MDGFRPDTYGEAFADIYRSWYGNITDADATARFVDDRCAPGIVLELGVGDGRLARPLAERGRCVVGVDASAAMLEQCMDTVGPDRGASAGEVLPLRADLAALPIHGPVGGAICAFNTLFNLASAEAQGGLLATLASALHPDGAVIVEAVTGHGLADSAEQSIGISRMSVDRLVLSATLIDAAAQTIAGQHVDISESGIRLRPWHLRWTTPSQLDALASGAGLRLSERHGGWNGEPFVDDSEVHISVYRRRSADDR